MALSQGSATRLVNRLKPPDGGFTYNTRTRRHFKGSGFAVAIPGAEKRFSPGIVVTNQHLQHYEQVHNTFLSQRGVYLGGWHDPKTHDRSLDTSEVFAQKELGRAAMVARGEDAMTNMSNFHSTRNKYKAAHVAGKISDADYEIMQAGAKSLHRRYTNPQ